MMTDDIEDLQEKYQAKQRELKPTVPLAADAAHLLTEYLDTMAVEFVRHGIAEPYRITREYEEIFVRELEDLGSTTKLTYDVVDNMLDTYGEPQQLVRHYISEHDLNAEEILAIPKQQIAYEDFEEFEGSQPDRLQQLQVGLRKFMTNYGIYLEITTILLAFITAIGYELFSISNLFIDPLVFIRSSEYLPLFFIPFLIVEIVTGLKGTNFNKTYYHTFREITRFLLISHLIMTLFFIFDNIYLDNFVYYLKFIMWTCLVIFFVGWLKDHIRYMNSSSPREKPVARFFLPSYVLLILTYSLAFALTLQFSSPYSNFTIIDIYRGDSIILVFFLGIASLLMDVRRKYPISVKKIGLTVLLGILPFFVYSQSTYGYRLKFSINDWNNLLISSSVWIICCVIAVALLFRHKIMEELSIYKQQLNDYRE